MNSTAGCPVICPSPSRGSLLRIVGLIVGALCLATHEGGGSASHPLSDCASASSHGLTGIGCCASDLLRHDRRLGDRALSGGHGTVPEFLDSIAQGWLAGLRLARDLDTASRRECLEILPQGDHRALEIPCSQRIQPFKRTLRCISSQLCLEQLDHLGVAAKIASCSLARDTTPANRSGSTRRIPRFDRQSLGLRSHLGRGSAEPSQHRFLRLSPRSPDRPSQRVTKDYRSEANDASPVERHIDHELADVHIARGRESAEYPPGAEA